MKSNAVIFANGLRKRMILETGGQESLNQNFSYFIGLDAWLKPWDYNRNFEDKIIDKEHFFEFINLKQLDSFLTERNIKNVMLVGFAGSILWRILPLIRLISKYQITYFYFDNRIDLNKRLKSFASTSPNKHEFTLKQKVTRSLIPFLYRKFFGLRKPKANLLSHDVFLPLSNASTNISIPHREVYRLLYEPAPSNNQDYILYLYTATVRRYENKEDVINMMKIVRRNLSKLQEKYDRKVIVSLHPNNSDFEYEYFNQHFETYKVGSAGLARNAYFIVTHYSIAINFGYVINKPFILAKVEDGIFRNNIVDEWAQLHNLPILTFTADKELPINEKPRVPSNKHVSKLLNIGNYDARRYEEIIAEVLKSK